MHYPFPIFVVHLAYYHWKFFIQYIVWNIISIGLNIVIVLIYQDIGLLAQVRKTPFL